ncbi:sialic acid-binding Ig-like lectin 13 [Pseudorasbora parva]|uniref:sialic acid-binding Ig-like lectin 13 n=1 Tax=Pseudorasbora parva TaxID=51549 RepID=UPI00351E2092
MKTRCREYGESGRDDEEVSSGVCCRNFNISLPEKIKALSGSCVIIKCTFEIEEKYDTYLTESAATGIWRKDGINTNNQVFNSRDPNSRFKGEITGTLHEKNCTTIFYDVSSGHNGKYYFRIESDGLKYNYESSPSTINVIESPPEPTVKLIEEQEVLEESSVSLRCSAESLCSSPPPTLTWSSTPRIPLSEIRQQELISDLNFTATHRQPRVTFTCTITYQLRDKNKTALDNITLHVQYASKISPSSSCNGSNVTVCFCEVDGNPSPELEWRLSGRPVTNSSNTFISEERLNSTGLRSSITLHQSLTHTSTLECVGNNTHGTARKLLQLPLSVNHVNLSSVMIGVAVGAVLVIMFCAVTFICVRKKSIKLQQTTREGATRSISTSDAVPHENGEESVNANDVEMSSAGTATENSESLIYSSIDFNKFTPESREFKGVSSLDADYAVVKRSGRVAKAESSVGESLRTADTRVIVKADVITKPKESKDVEKELFADSSPLYATVKHRKP